MKTKKTAILMAALLIGAVGMGWNNTHAAPPAAAMPESPVGRLVYVTLVAWPLSTAAAGTLNGTLIAMPTGWLVIKDGSYEHWVPMEKVMSMRVTR